MTSDTNSPTAFGLDLQPLDDQAIPLEAIVIVKCLDEDGDITIEIRHTDGILVWDRIGMLTCALDVARQHSKDAFRPADDDEDES